MELTRPEINSPSEQRVKSLQAILFLLQTNLEGVKDEVDRSYALLKIGEKTPLTKNIEKTLNNPLGNIVDISGKIDEQVKKIMQTIIKGFFQQNISVISKVYRSNTSSNDLHYSIVLKEDNIENRSKIFEFFDQFDLMDLTIKYPVYFQFTPIELVNKITHAEEIKFA